MTKVPVIAVDGPSGVGKGTVCEFLARHFNYGYLDSGALYRITAIAAQRAGLDLTDETALTGLTRQLDIDFVLPEKGDTQIFLAGEEISQHIRTEQAGGYASQVAVHNGVREALLSVQREMAVLPGLVADGRDMGTVVFPQATCKIYLMASAQTRAQRRYKQLKDKGLSVNLPRLLEDIQLRDERDANREVSPLRPASDAVIVDSSDLSILEVENVVLDIINRNG